MLDKSSIPYDKIDEGIREIVKLFNLFPFCATTLSCQGHPSMLYDGPPNKDYSKYAADFYIVFEVYNEKEFLSTLKFIADGFYETTDLWLRIIKHYVLDASLPSSSLGSYFRLSFAIAGHDPNILEEKMKKGRDEIEKRLSQYSTAYQEL